MSSDSKKIAKTAASVRPFILIPLFILLSGALLTSIVYNHLSKCEAVGALDHVTERFKMDAQDRISVIKQGIHSGLEGVGDITALLCSTPGVDRASFGAFAQNMLEDHTTIQALEWIPRVPDSEREDFERQARHAFPHFHITERQEQGIMVPAANRSEYFPVYYVEPYAGNEPALGFDLASEATRKAALEYSRDNNQLAVSGRITLVQEHGNQFGFLAFRPIYRNSASVDSVAQRRRQLIGYALGVFRVMDMVETALVHLEPRGMDVWLFDASARPEDSLLYWHGSRKVPKATVMRSLPKEGLHEVALISIGNRQWRIHIAPAPGMFQPASSPTPKILLYVGMLFSGLLAFYYHTRLRHAARLKCAKETLVAAEETQRLLSSAVQASSNGVIITSAGHADRSITIQYVNPAFTAITGYSFEEAVGRSPAFLYGKDRKQSSLNPIRSSIRLNKEASAVVRNYRKDGSLFWNHLLISPVIDEQDVVRHCVGIVNDITEQKKYEEQLARQANYDPLTGMVNRNLLHDRIDQAVAHAKRKASKVAVLHLDMDRFKIINDKMNHSAGDEVLKIVAQRLDQCIRKTDTLARIVGDEFVLVLTEMTTPNNVTRICEQLLEEVNQPLLINDQELQLTASIGVSLYPDDSENGETLLKHADMAMQRAKEKDCNKFQFFTEELNTRVTESLALENDLRRALERDQLRLHYQPQADFYTGRITGMEALIRWQHPQMGMVPPGRFIPVAEQTGLIGPIGEWVLKTACRQGKAWLDEGLPAITISVNLSAEQLRQQKIAQQVQQILEESGLPPQQLDLEVTESMLMENPTAMRTVLEAIKSTGIGLSMDDFGTGYSSLSYLRRFPFDTLKIDRSFVIGVTDEPEQAAIVSAILSLARSLKLKVVAEGVETLAQQNYLRRKGCDTMQGYYFSHPLPPDEAARLLREDRRLAIPKTDTDNDRTLLIVDDEEAVIDALARMLRREGYRILTATSPSDGLRLMAKEEVGVVLSDQRMPVMSGVEFLTRVKALHPNTVRIALSGYSDMDQIIEAINQGAIYKFITKPWDKSLLCEQLREGFKLYEALKDKPTIN